MKWMIRGDAPHAVTIVDAISENAAMQLARTAFGPSATWKALTVPRPWYEVQGECEGLRP